jgi:hypothetical protein
LKKHFRNEIDNPLLYHLTLNTDWIGEAEAADLITHALLNRFARAG